MWVKAEDWSNLHERIDALERKLEERTKLFAEKETMIVGNVKYLDSYVPEVQLSEVVALLLDHLGLKLVRGKKPPVLRSEFTLVGSGDED